VLYAALKGRDMDKDRLEAAKFVVGKMVVPDGPKNVQMNFISWSDVQKSAIKAGIEKLLKEPPRVIDVEAAPPKESLAPKKRKQA
jgi:hypothetical protein